MPILHPKLLPSYNTAHFPVLSLICNTIYRKDEREIFCWLTEHHAMQMYGGLEVQLH
jgi:hypothetical protein